MLMLPYPSCGGGGVCVWEISITSSDRMSILTHQLDRVLV